MDVNRRLIVRVTYGADGFGGGDWDASMDDPRTGAPMILPAGAVDYADFALNVLGDPRPMLDLREFRAVRAALIEQHFRDCARRLIEKIEAPEEWHKFDPRLSQSPKPEKEGQGT